ncbi:MULTISPECIES: SAVED domain-containing protein [Vibrio]|uniref:SAVED domain-containing protein n=1 Tax=Vibrio TaxID=662 RepID=UPI000DE48A4D|nr:MULTISPECIES: SAVED domain-containing protein [Vibrio]EGR0442569.1 SAVED domain-containing protein [Vibrio cholerae]EGR0451259.1 SAVED domain-containing protein [Vibrio cholerae]EJL6706107.1 SAVED domain-containing protein [Vibrio cholerae]MCX9560614.1 SAVED domain-containing protein [Vibrio cholerae]MCX9562200.1 SAVED domain-containing protein [Vibrio cholerae]
MKSSFWEKFKWTWKTFWSLKRTPYPRTKWGTGIIIASVGVPLVNIGLFAIELSYELPISSISYINKENSMLSGLLALLGVLSGIALIYSEWNNTSRSTAKVLISSMPNTNLEFPDVLLDPAEKASFREPVVLGIPASTHEDIEAQINLFNAEQTANVFNRFIIQENCKKLYIGGLARVPFLVSYGALLRNMSIDVHFFDKSHTNQREWVLLNEEKVELHYHTEHDDVSANVAGDIALAVSFTNRISEAQIPIKLRGHTLFVSPSTNIYQRNLIKNQENLNDAARFIVSKVDELSQRENVKRIHFFLSVQSPLAVAIGQRFQEGMHKKWVIHNFNAEIGKYEWGLDISSLGVSYFDSLTLNE